MDQSARAGKLALRATAHAQPGESGFDRTLHPHGLVCFDEHYGSREQPCCHDVAVALNARDEILTEHGAKIIQIDELAFPGMNADIKLVEDGLAELTRGINAYVILRIPSERLADAWARMQRWPVDQFYIDMVNTDFQALPWLKKTKSAKDIAFGIVSSHENTAEPVNRHRAPHQKILPVHPAERIWFGTDSGLKPAPSKRPPPN